MSDTHVYLGSAAVIKPGDRVLISLGESSGSVPDTFPNIAKLLNERFPGVEFTVVAGDVAVMSPEVPS